MTKKNQATAHKNRTNKTDIAVYDAGFNPWFLFWVGARRGVRLAPPNKDVLRHCSTTGTGTEPKGIIVVDGHGICIPLLEGTDQRTDRYSHGTTVASIALSMLRPGLSCLLIEGNAPDYQVRARHDSNAPDYQVRARHDSNALLLATVQGAGVFSWSAIRQYSSRDCNHRGAASILKEDNGLSDQVIISAERTMLIVVASPNQPIRIDNPTGCYAVWPHCSGHKNVISFVRATDDGRVADEAAFGSGINFAIREPDERYLQFVPYQEVTTSTSVLTAFAAGFFANVRAAYPQLTPKQIIALAKKYGDVPKNSDEKPGITILNPGKLIAGLREKYGEPAVPLSSPKFALPPVTWQDIADAFHSFIELIPCQQLLAIAFGAFYGWYFDTCCKWIKDRSFSLAYPTLGHQSAEYQQHSDECAAASAAVDCVIRTAMPKAASIAASIAAGAQEDGVNGAITTAVNIGVQDGCSTAQVAAVNAGKAAFFGLWRGEGFYRTACNALIAAWCTIPGATSIKRRLDQQTAGWEAMVSKASNAWKTHCDKQKKDCYSEVLFDDWMGEKIAASLDEGHRREDMMTPSFAEVLEHMESQTPHAHSH